MLTHNQIQATFIIPTYVPPQTLEKIDKKDKKTQTTEPKKGENKASKGWDGYQYLTGNLRGKKSDF